MKRRPILLLPFFSSFLLLLENNNFQQMIKTRLQSVRLIFLYQAFQREPQPYATVLADFVVERTKKQLSDIWGLLADGF